MNKRHICIILAAALLMTSCSSTAETEAEQDETIAETEQTIVETQETETEATETSATETTEDTRPWAERIGADYEISELDMPIYVYSDIGGEEIEGSGQEEIFHYTIPSVEISEPDEDGYVTYYINYVITGSYSAVIPFETADHTDGWHANPQVYDLVDYYTGTLIGCDQYYYAEDEFAVTFTYNGEEITVYPSIDIDVETPSNETTTYDDDTWGWDISFDMYVTTTVRVPQEYDGLLLYIYADGWTQEDHENDLSGEEDTLTEGDILEPDDGFDSVVFVDPDDIMIE